MPRCRDCKLYDLDAARSKSGAILSNRAARCLWVSKEQCPVSVTSHSSRPIVGYRTPNDEHRCPVFQKRDSAKVAEIAGELMHVTNFECEKCGTLHCSGSNFLIRKYECSEIGMKCDSSQK